MTDISDRAKIEKMVSRQSEAGIIASLIHNPELYFYSEKLLPNHFYDDANRYIYTAIGNLINDGITTIDVYNMVETLSSKPATSGYEKYITAEQLSDFVENSDSIARYTPEEYKMLVNHVMDLSFRRDTFKILKVCRDNCSDLNINDIQQKIYKDIDRVMISYSSMEDIPEYADVVDECWQEIQDRQGEGYSGIPFKFPTLNEYVTIENGELVVFGADAKQGKSMLLLNCAVDLLKQNKSVLYLDSELNTRLFTARLLSHLSGVEYRRLVSGTYSEEQKQSILDSIEWMKTRKFTHIYIPTFDLQSIYTAVKRINNSLRGKEDSDANGLDVLIVDYFKSSSEGDAWDSYAELGRFVDMVKNQIAGDMGIAAIGATQATSSGKIADSAKIARNASTIILLQTKTPEEIETDGVECGNKKLTVLLNRNGMQHAPGEYIDLQFDGNHIMYTEAKQHIPVEPF